MLKLLKSYKKRLANLSSKNRSLVLLRPNIRHFFDLQALDFIQKEPSFQTVASLINKKKKILLCPEIDPRDGQSNVYSKNLKKVARTDQLLQTETGSEDLHVGYPFVEGKLLDGTLLRCPLLFFPVVLQCVNNQWSLQPKNAGISFNRTFLAAYAQFNGCTIDEAVFEESFEAFSSEPLVFLTQLYDFLKESKLEINFNADLFEQKLISFEPKTKEDFESTQIGEVKLQPQAVLGIFPQAGSYIAADYAELISGDFTKKYISLEDFLFEEKPTRPPIKEEHMHLPLLVDASQEEAIRQIKAGKSLIVQGPPGTGKSQLIGNLMADYAAEGKRVLLVCQKRAAIDTVYNRLSEIGMENFAALVHDFKTDRKTLYEKIALQIENIIAYKYQNQSLNAIFLDREFATVCRKTDQVLEKFGDFKTALYDASLYGKSPKELYLKAEQKVAKDIDLKDVYPFFHFNTIEDFLQKLNSLERYRDTLLDKSEASLFWLKRLPLLNFAYNHLSELKACLSTVCDLKAQLNQRQHGFDFNTDLEEELKNEGLIETYFQTIKDEKSFLIFQTQPLSGLAIGGFINEIRELEDLDKVQNPLNDEDLDAAEATITKASIKTSNALKSRFWKLFDADKESVYCLLDHFSLERNPKQFPALLGLIKQHRRLNQIAGLLDTQNTPCRTQVLDDCLRHKTCHDFSIVFLKHFKIKPESKTKIQYESDVEEWSTLLNNIKSQKTVRDTFLSTEQTKAVNHQNLNDFTSYIDSQFDNLHGRDQLYDNLTAIEKQSYLLTKKAFSTGFAANFQSNLILHFIEDLENKQPILRSVSSLQLEIWEKELAELVLKKLHFSKDYLLLKLRENTYKNIEKNRLGNATTYRELLHQCIKQRQVWPIRKVVQQFNDELFSLVPCWMASPETVSAIFPLEEKPLFDLVIFDEASQCFAEKGLSAMLRGQQVVIAGDSQQLQPSDIYHIKLEEDTEDDLLLEKESLLDLGASLLPSIILRGHYRSKNLDLIAFSNKHFYNNKLKLLPDFKEINDGIPGIEYIKINGIWKDSQNLAEAQKVRDLVSVLSIKTPNKSIGVVTFNFHQAELIQDLCPDMKNLTVKNIENIQGDEFDIVIFSIAYAPDEKGKIRMNFGSLNQKGGENRLNVAITRAKEKIKVVCSLWPQQLQVEHATNNGPKLLQAYLTYAKNISEGTFQASVPTIRPTSWSRQLKNELQKTSPRLSTVLHFSDLAYTKDGKYEHLILTDDEQFYEAESLKESFAYLPKMLADKGWDFHRVWSRNWWFKPVSQLPLLEGKQEKE